MRVGTKRTLFAAILSMPKMMLETEQMLINIWGISEGIHDSNPTAVLNDDIKEKKKKASSPRMLVVIVGK